MPYDYGHKKRIVMPTSSTLMLMRCFSGPAAAKNAYAAEVSLRRLISAIKVHQVFNPASWGNLARLILDARRQLLQLVFPLKFAMAAGGLCRAGMVGL
jgi:hypothetical protein